MLNWKQWQKQVQNSTSLIIQTLPFLLSYLIDFPWIKSHWLKKLDSSNVRIFSKKKNSMISLIILPYNFWADFFKADGAHTRLTSTKSFTNLNLDCVSRTLAVRKMKSDFHTENKTKMLGISARFCFLYMSSAFGTHNFMLEWVPKCILFLSNLNISFHAW